MFSSSAYAANKYWIGAGGNWSTNTNWSNSSGGASCACVPGNTDIAVFDDNSTGDSTLDAGFGGTVDGVDIKAGYVKTVTQQRNLIVEISYIQADGTWQGGANNMDFANTAAGGGFTLSGGRFEQPTGTFGVETNFTITGGTYVGGNDEITFDGATLSDDTTVTCTGNLLSVTGATTINVSKTGASPGEFIVGTGCNVSNAVVSDGLITVNADGTLNSTGTYSSDNLTINGAFTADNASFALTSGNLTANGGTNNLSAVSSFDVDDGDVIVNAGKTLTVGASTLYIERNLTNNGTFTLTGKALVFNGAGVADDTTVGCSGDFNSLTGVSSVTANKTGASPGDFVVATGCEVTATVSDGIVNVSADGTLNSSGAYSSDNLSINGYFIAAAASFALTSGNLLANGTSNDLSAVTSFDIDDGDVIVNAGKTLVVGASTLYMERNLTINGTFNVSGKSLVFNGNGNADDTTISCSGDYNSLTGAASVTADKGGASPGDFVVATGCEVTAAVSDGLISVSTDGTLNASGAYSSDNLSINGYFIAAASTFTLTDGDLIANGAANDLSAATSINIDNGGLIINAGKTLVAGPSTINIEKNFTNNGTFTSLSSKTLVFDGTVDTDDTTYTNTATIGGLTINKTHASSYFVLGSNLTVSGDVTRTDGPVNNPGSAYTLYAGGNFSMSTTDAFGGSNMTVELNGTGTQLVSQNAANTFNPVFKVNKNSGEAKLSTSLTQSTQACNIVEGIFNLNNKNFTCGGTLTVENGGTLKRSGLETVTATGGLTLSSGSTVEYAGDGDDISDSVTVTALTANYHHLKISNSGTAAENYQLGANADMNGDFIQTGGTFDVTATPYNMTVGGNWNRTGGTFTPRTGTVTFDTVSNTTTVSGDTTFAKLVSTTSNKNITFTAGSVTTVSGDVTWTGTAGNLVTLRSSSTGSYWYLNSLGAEGVSYVDVKDSNATGGGEIVATNSTDSGWNPNWNFGAGNPDTPDSLGPTAYVTDTLVTDTTPTLTFVLDDPANENVKFRIQIDDTRDFSSPVVDYTSALAAEGNFSFTVGQSAGGGTYTTGSAGQTLPYGSYYWQVKAIDASTNESSYATANSGKTAFRVGVYTVTVTADDNATCDASCSLREAITSVNADGTSPRYVEFNIPSSDPNCSGSGVCTISPTATFPGLTAANTTINGYTQSGASANTNATGALNSVLKIQIDGTGAGTGTYGLDLQQGNITVKGLSIYNFDERGIYAHVAGTGVKIQGNYIGVKADGNTGGRNKTGGVYISTTDNCYIGTDGDGSNDAQERNLISANGLTTSDPGVSIASTSTGNLIAGNLIGLNAGGTADLGGAGSGIYLGSSGNTVGTNADGTSDATERNVISGNSGYGISIVSGPNTIAGNYIGTDADGAAAVGNSTSGINVTANNNVIGTNGDGTNDAAEGNVISGGGSRGVYLASGTGNAVKGNIIGLNAAGTGALANAGEGIRIDSANNVIGANGDGTAEEAERNVISANTGDGIRLTTSGATGNVIAGNYIGVASDGTTDQGNGKHGIEIDTSAANNTVGGDNNTEQNYIVYNGNAAAEYGIYLTGALTDNNSILRNKMFSNQNEGIKLAGDGANNNLAKPSITGKSISGSNLLVIGTTGTGSESVELFDASSDNEGETYLSKSTADSSGNWTVTLANSSYTDNANNLVATTTDGTDGTSEFSNLFTITTNAPSAPTGLGSASYVNGDNATDTTPTLSFTLPADPDGDTVKYQIQIDDNSNFASPIVDYASALDASGAKSFTVGQAAGTGTYTSGSQYTVLPPGNIYWRVRNIDFYNSASAYSTANGGGVAFIERVYTVTTTSDDNATCDTSCSLREAIQGANNDAYSPRTVEFAVNYNTDPNCVAGTQVCTFSPASFLPTITGANLTINGYTQYGAAAGTNNFPNAINATIKVGIDGSSTAAGSDGIAVNAADVTVKGLSIYNFPDHGVTTVNTAGVTGMKVQGCFIGVKPDGETADGNSTDGVYITGANNDNVVIGVDGDGVNDAQERNVISANGVDGMSLIGDAATVAGNFIGTNAGGTVDLGNVAYGIDVNTGDNHVIGTDGDGVSDDKEGNVISGNNLAGIGGGSGVSSSLVVAGNYIGVDATGTADLGNVGQGVYLWGDNAARIGTNADGTSDTSERNVISGNNDNGVEGYTGSGNAVVQGNYIGLGSDGSTRIGNSLVGVYVNTTSGWRIGTNGDAVNDAAEGNYISSNGTNGVQFNGSSDITIAGNKIGINVSGTDAGNDGHGVTFTSNGSQGTVGGDIAAEANVIAYNGNAASEYGVVVNCSTCDANVILRNSMYDNQDIGIKLASGGNNDKAVPQILGAVGNVTNVDIYGTSPAASDTVELFDASSDNEGEMWLSKTTADGSGNWTITISSPYTAVANNLVATASDSTTANGTSQFTSAYSVPNLPPSAPTSLGPAAYVGGDNATDTTPALSFVMGADVNSGDTVKYRIQLDDNSSFASPFIEYGSALGISGSQTFTVGQAAGSGAYVTGSADTRVPYGNVYWRVRTEDSSGGTSSYVAANGGGVAFVERVYTVTVTADDNATCDASCSLREAMTAANADSYSPRTIEFSIPSDNDSGCVPATDVCTISPTSVLPSVTAANTTIDGYSQTGAAYGTNDFPDVINATLKVVIDGTGAGAGVDGITINNVANNTIKGLVIREFADEGIVITGASATGNKIQGNFVGTDATGELDKGNVGSGIETNTSATGNYIGVDTDGVNGARERNLVSGNTAPGVNLLSASNYVMGNFIGTNVGGTVDVGNTSAGVSSTSGNSNIIGTNGDGTADTVEGNLVSGNNSHGIYLSGMAYAVVAGNRIGVNAAGTGTLGNTGSGVDANGTYNRVGTNADGISDTAERNIIGGAGAGWAGVSGWGGNHTVAGNYIGIGADGVTAIPNNWGIFLRMTSYSWRIGTNGDGVRDDVERNVISGNTGMGVYLANTVATNIIAGNYIGVGADGTSDKGNGSHGIGIDSSVEKNLIGGDSDNEGNVIAYNGDAAAEYGIYVASATSDNNTFWRNKMYSNQDIGIKLVAGANSDIAAPTVSGRTPSGALLNVVGTGTANAVIQVFDASSDNEGETYLGQSNADGSGNWTVSIASPYTAMGNTLVATASGSGGTDNGTSQFSSLFTIANVSPNTPSALGPATLVNGSSTSDATPTFTFTLSDNDGDTVKYQIQIDDNSNFASPAVDYTSALQSGGSASYTVGQAAGSGAYATGAPYNVLQKGNWYWRVRAIDYFGSNSDNATANGGGIAFAESAYTVNVTADDNNTCDTSCSLREAIQSANAASGNTIQFAVDSDNDTGCSATTDVCTISPTSALPDITASSMTVDGYTQSGSSANTNNFPSAVNAVLTVVLDGTGAGASVNGLKINNVANVTIKGLNIRNFYQDGVHVTGASATGVKVQGNFLGTNEGGTTDKGNARAGVYVTSSAVAKVGIDGDGTNDAAERNLISANDGYGIYFNGASGSVAAGNIIGADKTGTSDLGNGVYGIQVGCSSCIVGTNGDGTSDAIEGNLISGNDNIGVATNVGTAIRVAGNYIGTNLDGTGVISNTLHGVNVGGNGGYTIIGTNADGTSDAAERNVISGNIQYGVVLNTGSTGCVVAGNYIGTKATGLSSLSNGYSGVLIYGYNNRIGTNGDSVNDVTERNVISGNSDHGVYLYNATSTGNIVAGNYVGLGSDGVSDVGNLRHGIAFGNGASNNLAGGDIAAEANVIAFNGDAASEYGVYVTDATSDNNTFWRNSMYSNQNEGIKLVSNGNNNQATPSIVARTPNGSQLDISGSSTANATVQIFDASSDNEGETYISQTAADGSGNWTVAIGSPYNARDNTLVVTATGSDNSTSEFSSLFTIANTAPNVPTALGPTALVNASSTADATPTFTFTLSDNDSGDTVGYQIQIDDNSSFATPEIDYRSALAAQGSASYTVGQAAGGGTYTMGAAGSVLQKGDWYWRVRAHDYFSDNSSYVAANGGSVAFAESNYTVNVTADDNATCDTSCSFREAIQAANGASGNTVQFEIPTADANYSGGVWTISPTSALPSIAAASMIVDGYSQPGAVAGGNAFPSAVNAVIKIGIDGTSAGNGADGVTVNAANVMVRGLSIYGFPDSPGVYTAHGVNILNNAGVTGTKVQGCFIGVKPDGTTVSKNQGNGVTVNGTNNTGVIIGVDGDGTSDAAERNLISGNDNYGVWLAGPSTLAGNTIGTDQTGAADKGQRLVAVYCSNGQQIIGTDGDGVSDAQEGNLISGNDSHAIRLAGSGCNNSVVAGNYIGTNQNGMSAIGNSGHGVIVNAGVSGVRIGTNSDGTSDTAERNVLSGNSGAAFSNGVRLEGSAATVRGNYIGLNAAGTGALGNALHGIYLLASDNNTIGTNGDGSNDTAERNYVSGNTTDGVNVDNSDNNVIAGNWIGLTADSTSARNNRHGIYLVNGSLDNTIGGDIAAEANNIANNGDAASEYGVYLAGAASDGNDILRNSFYSNQNEGIKLAGDGANNNQAAPAIASDSCWGRSVIVYGTSGNNNTIRLFDASSDNEGETYLNETAADGSGNWTVYVSDPAYAAAGNNLVLTATDNSNGTSEFSAVRTLTSTNCNRERVIIVN